jgi:cytidylate kinase
MTTETVVPQPDVIAIDGPAASGKSTVARRVAAALGWLYVDSGALYRGVTFQALRDGVSTADAAGVLASMRAARFEFAVRDGAVVFSINGFEPRQELRTAEVNLHVSHVAATEDVRRQVTAWLRAMTEHGPLVMEGRDIGTVVFPEARFRFYLDASEAERARRRHAETAVHSQELTVEEVDRSLQRRDRIDSTRAAAPLRVAPGAIVLDTTGRTIADVVADVLAAVGSVSAHSAAGT